MAQAKVSRYQLELYSPHLAQRQFHNSSARFRVVSYGRQSGKSTACLNELARRAWEKPGTYWFISPSYDQAKVQFYRFLNQYPPDCGIYARKPNESSFWLQLISGSNIYYKSGAVLHRLRGESLAGCVIDEVRDQPPELWKQVVQPMLTTTNGWAAMVSTPRGFDAFYDLATKAQECSDNTWEFFSAPSTCNPLFSQEEFNRLRSEMTEAEFAQEVLAEFREIQRGSAYTSFSVADNLTEVSPISGLPSSSLGAPSPSIINPYLPIELYCDWNVTFMSWVIGQFRNGKGHYFFDEVYLERSHTEEAAALFVHKFREHTKGINFLADPNVIIVGDATGNAQKTSASGKTDFTILETALRKAGITYRNLTPSSNPLVKDRVNTVNSRLKSADGTVQIWFHPKLAPKTKRDFQRVTWKLNATGAILDQTTDPSLTHLSDAVGYGVCVRNPMHGVSDVGSLRIIRR